MISPATRTFSSLSRATTDPRFQVFSPVNLAEDWVHAGDDGNRVGDEAIAHHVRKRLEVDERRSADVHAIGLGTSVADDVAADLAARALDGDVDLALGHLEAFREQLEVVDQGLHRLVDTSARRRCDLFVLDADVAGGHSVDDLANDLHRLTHLVDADSGAIEGI